MSASELFSIDPDDQGDLSAIREIPAVGEVALPQLTSATIRLWKAFAPLALERRRWALATGSVETFVQGARYASSDEVTVVVSGCLMTDAAGSDLTADILRPGDVAATGDRHAVSGRWITNGELYRVKLETWLESAGNEGLMHLLAASGHRRAMLERRILCATNHRATARVADLFLAVLEAAPQPNIILSQAQLGGMLGLRRTTVNGSCRTLELAGGTRTRRGQIRIVDPRILDKAACGCRRVVPSPRAGNPPSTSPTDIDLATTLPSQV
jgi:CRP-like cAMP-binding protein